MKEIKYTDTWCDNLTPCPHRSDICVNDYDCCHCPHNKSKKELDNDLDEFTKTHGAADNDYYARYSKTNTGIVLCDYEDIPYDEYECNKLEDIVR